MTRPGPSGGDRSRGEGRESGKPLPLTHSGASDPAWRPTAAEAEPSSLRSTTVNHESLPLRSTTVNHDSPLRSTTVNHDSPLRSTTVNNNPFALEHGTPGPKTDAGNNKGKSRASSTAEIDLADWPLLPEAAPSFVTPSVQTAREQQAPSSQNANTYDTSEFAVARAITQQYMNGDFGQPQKRRRESDNTDPKPIIETFELDEVKTNRPQWCFQEPDSDILYPEFLEIDENRHFSFRNVFLGDIAYRGIDRPSFQCKSYKKKVGSKAIALLQVSCQEHQDGPTVSVRCGTPADRNKSRDNTRVRFRLDTQRPCVVVHFNRNGGTTGDDIMCEIYASNFNAGPDFVDFRFRSAQNAVLADEDMLQDEHAIALYEQKNLLLIDMRLRNGAYPPVFSGITVAELDAICNATPYVHPVDNVIAALRNGFVDNKIITIATEFRSGDWEMVEGFFDTFKSCSYAAANLGNYWWYRIAAGMELFESDFPFEAIPLPRWISVAWTVSTLPNGVVEDVHSTACVPYMNDSGDAVTPDRRPDPQTLIFENRLGISRELEDRLDQVRRFYHSMESMTATFRQLNDTSFIAYVSVQRLKSEAPESSVDPHLKPDIGTAMRLGVRLRGKDYEISGSVIDDPMRTENVAFVVALVASSPANAPRITSSTEWYWVSIAFDESTVSYDRRMASLEKLQDTQQRTDGVDIASVLLFSPKRSDVRTDWIKRLMSAERKDAFFNHLALFNLDEPQKNAARAFITSTEGLNLLWGPAGTGKTTMLKAFLLAMLTVPELKIIVTAPANEVLDKFIAALEDMEDSQIPHGVDRLCFVRFTGAMVNSTRSMSNFKPTGDSIDVDNPGAPSTETSDLDEPSAGSWSDAAAKEEAATRLHRTCIYEQMMLDAMSKQENVNKDHSFATRKYQWICACAAGTQGSTHEQAPAKEYLDLLEQVQKYHQKAKRVPKEIRRAFRSLDEHFTSVYLIQKVRVVVCTNNTSAHVALASFQPDLLIMEEAGLANLADAAVPFVAHRESVKHVLLCGDHYQLEPIILASKTNEAVKYIQGSIFESLFDDKAMGHRFPRNTLSIQYRMQQELSVFPREQIYEKKVQDGPSTLTKTRMQAVVEQKLDFLRCARVWNGRFRMAIDCQEPAVYYLGQTSPHNDLEALRATQIAALLLIDNEITPEDIVIISPYQGQVRRIKEFLRSQTCSAELHKIRVHTTYEMQGSEAEIVILSLVANVRGDPHQVGFIANKNQLTVELTRAKSFLVILGNFEQWVRAIKDVGNKKRKLNQPGQAVFKGLIEDLHKKRDIIRLYHWNLPQSVNIVTPTFRAAAEHR